MLKLKKTQQYFKLQRVPKTLLLVPCFIGLLLLLHLKALPSLLQSSHSYGAAASNTTLMLMLRDSVAFLPLKDLRYADDPMNGNTWFMSSVKDTFDPDDSEYLHFPSNSSNGRLLCLLPRDRHDGAANSYGFAYPQALPYGGTLFPGLTYVSDTQYDYSNLWHGLNAVVPFIGWHMRRGCAVPPARWVLFHWGELRTDMAAWLKSLAEATIGKVKIETFEGVEGPACFEEAVVFRHNQGGIAKKRLREVYDRIRCLARESCNVEMEKIKVKDEVGMTVLLRNGARSFKNETAVVRIFEEVCAKVKNCRVMAAKSDNLTFCDQVCA